MQRLNEIGQGHIAALLEKKASFIDPKGIERDLDQVDYPLLQKLLRGEQVFVPPRGVLEPVEIVPAGFADTPEAQTYIRQGEDLLARGKVAAVVVAGGQGSRLGIAGPKGAVRVSPVKGKSLFCIHAEKVLALQRRYGGTVPLFVMTSRDNDDDTKAFFAQHRYFGLSDRDVYFFRQGMLPSLTAQGEFILDREGALFMNPDGHGGTLWALKQNGCLDVMRARGIEEIFYFQVDNPLVKIGDPLFVGLHHARGAQMSSKILKKRDFEEKVGVVAKLNGRTAVIEYSDMPKDMMYATDDKGGMLYWAGSIAIHMLRVDFVERITAQGLKLPYHRAVKKIPTLDEQGKPVDIEGIKFETFIFDALPLTEVSVTLEVRRAEEFAPVKNPTGEDSLDSARSMQVDLHRAWLEHAGVTVGAGVKVEISPLFASDKDTVQQRRADLPTEIHADTYFG